MLGECITVGNHYNAVARLYSEVVTAVCAYRLIFGNRLSRFEALAVGTADKIIRCVGGADTAALKRVFRSSEHSDNVVHLKDPRLSVLCLTFPRDARKRSVSFFKELFEV